MKEIALIISLVLFLVLTACNQNSTEDLSMQGLEYGQVRFSVVSDFREGFEKTNLNGQFDKGEFLVPEFEIKLTPINEAGEVVGEAFSYVTDAVKDPRASAFMELPVGMYQPELVLPQELAGGDDYTWKPVGPEPIRLPAFILKYKGMLDGIYSVACEYGGRQLIEIRGFDEYPKTPCVSRPSEVQASISVSDDTVEVCNGQTAQVTVRVHYGKWSIATPVTLSVSGLPAGMTYSFSSNPTSTQSTLTLSANGVAPGVYTITVTDDRGYTVTLTVTVC
jgi:hypothetical protein